MRISWNLCKVEDAMLYNSDTAITFRVVQQARTSVWISTNLDPSRSRLRSCVRAV